MLESEPPDEAGGPDGLGAAAGFAASALAFFGSGFVEGPGSMSMAVVDADAPSDLAGSVVLAASEVAPALAIGRFLAASEVDGGRIFGVESLD